MARVSIDRQTLQSVAREGVGAPFAKHAVRPSKHAACGLLVAACAVAACSDTDDRPAPISSPTTDVSGTYAADGGIGSAPSVDGSSESDAANLESDAALPNDDAGDSPPPSDAGDFTDAGSTLADAAVVDTADSGTTTNGIDAAPAVLDPQYFDPNVVDDDIFHHANPDPKTIDTALLSTVIANAKAQSSDSIVIAVGDTIIAEQYAAGRGAVPLQSISKSVVSLAIGILIDEGKISSTSAPVSSFFPEWAAEPKSSVTIGHLLSMTSGMADDPLGGFYAAKDRLAYARARALTGPVGSFVYTDTGAMLFAGIVRSAAGVSIDKFVNDRIFSKIGITDAAWATDGAGNVNTAGGLYLSPRSMLRLGRLVRDGGVWNGTAIVSSGWMNNSAGQPSGSMCYGYLWWLDRANCSSLTPLAANAGPIDGTYAAGWGGNYITVVKSKQVLAVRTKDAASASYDAMRKTAFETFPRDVVALAR